MARRKNAPESIRVKHGLSERLRQLRTEFYGDRGGPDLARTLGIPVRTWYNYENGVTVPAEIILRVVELTAVEVAWLLRGELPKFRSQPSSAALPRPDALTEGFAGSSVTKLLRVALERLEEEEKQAIDTAFGSPILSRRDDEEEDDSDEIHFVLGNGNGTNPSQNGPGPNVRRISREVDLPEVLTNEGLESRRAAYRNLRAPDDSMAPIVAEGAHVAYAEPEPASDSFHDKLVVALIDGKLMVRWFQHCGRFALLRAENPATTPPSILVDLEREGLTESFHRVLWINTPH